jgi:MFS family permease
VIRTLSLAGFGLSLAGGGVFGLLVVHADQMRAVAPADRRVGLLYAAAAVGSLAAALGLPRLSRRLGEGFTSVVGYGGFIAAAVGLAVIHEFAVALVVWCVWECASTLAITNGITVRQLLTLEHLQGRVNTTGRMIARVGTPFGALFGGVVAETAGVHAAYLSLAVPVVCGLVLILVSPVPRLRLAGAVA